MDIEDLLRAGLGERAAAVRTSPDQGDLARRVRKAERARKRLQHLLAAAALVVVAGSAGTILGAVTDRPASQPSIAISKTDANGALTTSTVAHQPPADRGSATPTTTGPGPTTTAPSRPTTTLPQAGTTGSIAATSPQQALADDEASRHTVQLDGLEVNWLETSLASPVAVVTADGKQTACLDAHMVSFTLGGGTAFAGGSGVVGLPQLAPLGLAVVASGSFGLPGRPAGWWAIVEAGSDASSVAVQFPFGAVVRSATGPGGVAVLAALAPQGHAPESSVDASAVADGSSSVTSSLGFVLGGAPAETRALGGASSTSGGTSGGSASGGSGASGTGSPGGSGSGGSSCIATSGFSAEAIVGGHYADPPAPVSSAGEVVAAFEQAYAVDPLLGLAWNYSAVDVGSQLGCPVDSTLGSGGSGRSDGLTQPQVDVKAVEFTSSTSATVLYQRGAGLLETGAATLVGGAWKVSRSTYCRDLGTNRG